MDDLAVERGGLGLPVGVPQQIGGRFPRLENFPIVTGVLPANLGIEFYGFIQATLFRADIGQTTER